MPIVDRPLKAMDAALAENPLTPQEASNVLQNFIDRHYDHISRIDLAAIAVAIENLDSIEPDIDEGEVKNNAGCTGKMETE